MTQAELLELAEFARCENMSPAALKAGLDIGKWMLAFVQRESHLNIDDTFAFVFCAGVAWASLHPGKCMKDEQPTTPGREMRPRVHLRSESHPTKAVCGMGYTWPSSIALIDDIAQVTCRNCVQLAKEGACI